MKCFQCQWVRARKIATSVMVRGFLMKNSYQGYWFSCEPMSQRWFLTLESKHNNETRSIGLNDQMTMGDVMKMAFDEIEKLNKEKK